MVTAMSGGDPTPDAVLRAAADSEAAARDTFAAWATDETDPNALAAFEDVAAQEREHLDRVTQDLDGYEPPSAPGTLHASLRGRDGTAERVAAGLIGRVLVSRRVHEQVIAFFDRRGEPARVELFRDLRDETAALRERGQRLLDTCCEAPDDWEQAAAAVHYTIQVAADDVVAARAAAGAGGWE